MKTIGKAFVGLCLMLPLLAGAQVTTPRFDQRQINQENRIEQGNASGSLTAREDRRLDKGQQHVANVETRVYSDGTVTRQERAKLHHAQEVQSHNIYRQKHDYQHDYNHNGRVDRGQRR